MAAPDDRDPHAELEALRSRLAEAEQTLEAIRSGEVDALIVGDDVYTLDTANAASNRLRSDVLAQMKDAVVAVDAEERVIYLNHAAESQYRQSSSQVLGHPLELLFAVRWYRGDDQAAAESTLHDSGAWRGECVHVRRDGSEIHVESTVTVLREANAPTDGRLLVSRDVSERYLAAAQLHEAMAELARSQREFATLVENSPFIFARFDRELRHVYVSPRIEQVTGRPPSEFIGKTHEETGMPAALADEWRELMREVFASGTSRDAPFSFRTPDGELRHFETRLIPETSAEGEVESVLSIASDVTEREVADRERRAAEESLREADRRKDVFLATLAHELRNPLAPIGNALQIMRMSADSAAHDNARGMIERQLRQLVHLVDDLLDVSRISQGKVELRRERIELAAVIANAIETSRPVIDAGRHDLVLAPGAGPEIVVDGDMTRLTQVVANLLNNAAKYTPSGGRITVAARRQGEQAVISVADTGIGIPVDRLPDVFEMFAQVDRSSTRSQGGLGIGLALVKRLVEMHGGTVSAASEGPGRGSRFEVRLPAQPAGSARRADSAPDQRRTAAAHGARILVADDNRDSADSMAAMLSLMGFETAVAYDGDEALQVASELRPHAAILDIGMPRLSGDEVARRLRAGEQSRDMMLIALSGWGRDDDRRRTSEAGFDHHLVKPLDIDALVELLAAADFDARVTP
jgi:PAS domain S-box-containing protein